MMTAHKERGSRRLLKLAACGLASAVFALSGTVLAAPASYGANTANTYNYNQQVYVCDNEDDGAQAYDTFESAGATYYLYDGNGATSGCGYSGVYAGKIYRHRVCESVWGVDPCGGWVYN